MPWQLTIEVDRDSDTDQPLFARIADAIAGDIARGRLRPGQRLPGTRRLAADLGVNRGTVNAAIADLEAQGWIETRPARGSFVRGAPDPAGGLATGGAGVAGVAGVADGAGDAAQAAGAPVAGDAAQVAGAPVARSPRAENLARRAGTPQRVGFSLAAGPRRPAGAECVAPRVLALSRGIPDPRLFPGELLARAYRRALRRNAATLLDYGDAHGHPRLRAALADMLAEVRGLAAEPDDVLVTRGSQMALWLVARALIRPGDRVAVERYGYRPAWDALRAHGARLCPIGVDRDGARVDEIAALAAGGSLRAVYLTPHHQYPTMAVLAARRRLALLALARRHRFAIIEDDYDHEYHYEGRPILPLASADRGGCVVYVGTLSKVLAPGLRIGYVVAPRPLVERLAAIRALIDHQGDIAVEAAVAELMEDGELQRHVRRMRRVYHARRDALIDALRDQLGDAVSFDVPPGGMALWIHAPDLDVDAWAARAKAAGVLFTPGRRVSFHGRATPYARLGYACVTEDEIRRAVGILRRTARG